MGCDVTRRPPVPNPARTVLYTAGRDGQGLSQLREEAGVRPEPQPLDGRHEAALQPEPPEGADPRRCRAAPGVRLHPLPEGRQGHQSPVTPPAVAARGDRRTKRPALDPTLVRFRAVVQGALAHLESRRQEINDLNVFPVADGDTGDNMALTLQAVLGEVDRLAAEGNRSLDQIGRDEIVESVARAALLGARGNSGVILSQLIRGAAEELISRPGELVDPVLIGAAMARAAQRAYSSVRAPAEGTILTVMREMATRVATDIAHMGDTRLGATGDPAVQNAVIADVLERALRAGEEAVRRGPEQLAILRESGVVDAGGHALTVLRA